MSEPIPTDPVVDPDFPPEEPVPPEPEPVEPPIEDPIVKGWIDQIADAESRAAVEALRVATAEAEREAGEAEAAAKAYADLIDTGASDADIAAARAYAEEQAEEARVAAEAAAALDATGKADAAEQAAVVAAEADAAAKAAQAVTDAGAYTDAQIPLVAGRLVPRNMDRPPTVEDGTDLIAGTGWNQYDPATSDLVQMWRWDGATWQALDMSAEMIPVLDIGSATVGDLTGGRINVQDGPIVAGDPAGARVEITGDGLHAYDASGTETARIQGEGGEFVGGSFRTSDALPGQVTLADDAYVTHIDGGGTFPGIKVVPIDTTNVELPAGIGPSVHGLTIFGGRNTAGGSSIVQANPTESFMRTFREDGTNGGEIHSSPTASLMRTYREGGATGGVIQTSPAASLMRTYREDGTTGGVIQTSPTDSRMRTYSGNSSESGWVQVRPQDAELAYVDTNNTYFSRIKADASEAFIYTQAGGTSRYLSVDANGVWVKTNKSGSWASYNLEETAQDSGWHSITLASGISGSWSPAWRNKGGVIYFRGRVTKSAGWAAGWNVLVSDVGVDARPASHMQRAGATRGVGGTFLEVTTGGVLQVWFDTAQPGSTTVELSPMFYPLG